MAYAEGDEDIEKVLFTVNYFQEEASINENWTICKA